MQKHIYDLRFQVDKNEWRARAKRALIFQFWNIYKLKRNNYSMLDLGCGVGVFQKELKEKYPYIKTHGIDISDQAIKYCKMIGLDNVKTYNGKTIPYPNNSFNLVTAVDVLEHIQDDFTALNEIKRVLKKGGLGIFLVPAHKSLWSTRDIRLQHFRRYEKSELSQKAKKIGFTVLTEKNVDFALFFVLWAMCKISKKQKGIPHLKMETASTNTIVNELMYCYELFENNFQKISTFPTGISILNIVRKG